MARFDEPIPMSPERIAEVQAENKPRKTCWCPQCGNDHPSDLTPGELAWLLARAVTAPT